MAEPRISVLVLTYHPQKEALFSTLRSVVLQEDCDYEVIVTDDGSGAFFREEIETFFREQGVSNYQILAHAENQGTVKNILDGVNASHSSYIKPISPGDYLYDAHTLRDLVSFMDKNNAKAVFGKLVFYTCDPELTVKNLTHPIIPELYRPECSRYSSRKALKHQAVFYDLICGASAVYEKNAFAQALQTISPAVRLAEDTVFQLFAVQNTRIFYMDRLLVWYEHGTGVSTKQTTQRFTRIDEDFYRFYFHMAELFPQERYFKRACRFWQLRKDGNTKALLFSKLRLDKFFFSLRIKFRKKKLKIPHYHDEFFRRCHH